MALLPLLAALPPIAGRPHRGERRVGAAFQPLVERLASRLLAPAAALTTVLASSLLITGLWSRAFDGPPAKTVVVLHLLALLVALGFLFLGLLASVLFADPVSAFALSALVGLLLILSPLLAGPVIERSSNAERTIEAALLVSPPAAAASVLGWDIMRTELLYRHSPIGQRRFSYPSPGRILTWYSTACAGLFAAAVFLLAARRRRGDNWLQR